MGGTRKWADNPADLRAQLERGISVYLSLQLRPGLDEEVAWDRVFWDTLVCPQVRGAQHVATSADFVSDSKGLVRYFTMRGVVK